MQIQLEQEREEERRKEGRKREILMLEQKLALLNLLREDILILNLTRDIKGVHHALALNINILQAKIKFYVSH